MGTECASLDGRQTMPAADLLAKLPDDSAGIIITDPPWDLGGGSKFERCANYQRFDVETIADTLSEARRILKPGAHLYLFAPSSAPFFTVAKAFQDLGFDPIRLLCWDKGNDAGLGAYRNAFEPVIIFSNGSSRGYPGPPNTYPSLLKANIQKGRTAKPWELYRIFLKMSAKPGEPAIDPYCGTNPLKKAVDRLNRQQPWIASDILPPDEIALDLHNLQPAHHQQTHLPRNEEPK
jgi:DNA modification methylase